MSPAEELTTVTTVYGPRQRVRAKRERSLRSIASSVGGLPAFRGFDLRGEAVEIRDARVVCEYLDVSQ